MRKKEKNGLDNNIPQTEFGQRKQRVQSCVFALRAFQRRALLSDWLTPPPNSNLCDLIGQSNFTNKTENPLFLSKYPTNSGLNYGI